ncbi:ABC transporter substrate-binding protein [Nonomuraea candida]|uniref:ABC transporter substrate-binding protein n=1 Tax=Nonomuraea candida TaxID=359159 RepID=UPI0005BDC8F5|nr:ABC transporter substrate-binding protein [Nonomuraea candida]
MGQVAGGRSGTVCVGVVVPRTGRLSQLGDPLSFVAESLAPALAGGGPGGGGRRNVRLLCRDSRSDPETARRVVRELARDERVAVVVTMAGTKVLPAVADACEEAGLPCLSTTFPWQAFVYGRGGDPRRPFAWTYHFAWGLDDIADVFAEMWERLGPSRRVGCLWNDDLQGRLLRHPEHGFVPRALARGHVLTDLGGYSEPAGDFTPHLDTLGSSGAEIVTSAATGRDLALFAGQAAARGLLPRLMTCSRWLAYPHLTPGAHDASGTGDAPGARDATDAAGAPGLPDAGGEPGAADWAALARARVATLLYWSPRHPYRSSLDGTTAASLAEAYERRTGSQWLQPLGLAHALLEVALHALGTVADPADRRAVADAIAATRLSTIAGVLDWQAGPTPNVALVPLIGGQWRPGRHHPGDLAVVTNTALPEIPIEAELATAF